MINYTPFGHSDWQTIVSDIKKFGTAGKKTAVVSTINGDANVPFYKELGNQGIKATDIPVVAFSVGEEELAGIDTKPLVGHLAAWNYFQSVKTPENEAFIKQVAGLHEEPEARSCTNDPMEAHVKADGQSVVFVACGSKGLSRRRQLQRTGKCAGTFELKRGKGGGRTR
jgi:urea transport system substrate-binding protein